MTRAYDNAADARFPSGRRNLFINGDFQVWQRGTSFSSSGNIYTADRWMSLGSGATMATTQESFTIGQTDVPGEPEYYLQIDTATGNNNARLEQRVEDVRTGAGQSITVSFWAKGTNPTGGEFSVGFQQNFGSGGSTAVDTFATAFTVTSSWQKFTRTVTLPSISGKTIGTGSSLIMRILQPDGDTGTGAWELNIALAQLELGNVATPFEHRSYGEELALCQRYYQRRGATPAMSGSYYAMMGDGMFWDNADTAFINFEFPVDMRAAPSIESGGTFRLVGNGTDYTGFSSFVIQWPTTYGTRINASGSGYPATKNACFLQSNNDSSSYIAFNAEL